ncbi:MAG TPA: hypothetical protein VF818_10600, partial [Ktedonobacterales bacterium]
KSTSCTSAASGSNRSANAHDGKPSSVLGHVPSVRQGAWASTRQRSTSPCAPVGLTRAQGAAVGVACHLVRLALDGGRAQGDDRLQFTSRAAREADQS